MGGNSTNIFSRIKFTNISKSSILLIFGVVIILFALLIILSSKWHNNQEITKTNISGLKHIPKTEILSIIEPLILNRSKDKLFLLKNIEIEIEKHSFIADAVATIEKKNELNIQITERKPIGLFKKKDGIIWYLDSLGVIVPFRLISEYSDLVLVSSNSKQTRKDSLIGTKAASILNELNKYQYDDFNFLMSELIYNSYDSTFSFVCTDTRHKIQFGRSNEIHEKLKNLKKFATSQTAKDLELTNYRLDLRWRNRIIISQVM